MSNLVKYLKSATNIVISTAIIALPLLGTFSISPKVSADPSITSYTIPWQLISNNESKFRPYSITNGPDGALWFTITNSSNIFRIDTSGNFSEFPVPSGSPTEITTGPDGNLWYTDHDSNLIGRMTTSGDVTQYPIPVTYGWSGTTFPANPEGITTGPDGAL